MKYQLVLQWTTTTSDDYETMIQMEEILMNRLPRECLVDGHDCGAGEMNIFIFTNDPSTAFKEVKRALEGEAMWPEMRAAFRDRERSEYTILWPKDLHRFVVT